jgi:hypothetical protein
MTATTQAERAALASPQLAEPASLLRDPLCEVVARCGALDEAALMLADRLADSPAVLLLLIKAHLARAAKAAA